MRKFLVFLLGIFIFSLLVSGTVFAQTPDEVKILPADETVDRDYFSLGERAEINGTVNGDAYVLAGQVNVTGEINGDLLAAGGSLVVSGEVNGDVRVAGGTVTFSGAEVSGNVTVAGGNVTIDRSTKIEGSIVAAAGNLQVFSSIGKGATIGGGNVMIAAPVGGDVQVGSTNLSVSPDAVIDGNLTYYSESEASISEGAVIDGEVTHELPKQVKADAKGRTEVVSGENAGIALAGLAYALKAIDTFWLIIIGLLFIYLMPKFSHRTAEYATKKLGWAFLAGIITLIVVPVIGFIFMITIIGIPISLLLIIGYILLFWFGRIFTIYAIGLLVVSRLSKKHTKGIAFIAGVIIYLILSVIPVVGFLVSLVVSVAGVGALVITKGQVYKELRAKNVI